MQESYLGLNGSISYYPAALNWLGFKSSVIMYEQGNRRAGTKTKYNFKSRARLAIEVIISHSRKPLRLAIFLGTFMAAVGLGLGILVFVMYLNNTLSQPGWASLFVAIVTLSGIQLFTLGIFGLYIGEIANSTQNKPQFVILKD